MAKFKCIVCGENADSPYCFRHKPKKPLKRGRIKQKLPSDMEEKKEELVRQKNFFLSIWLNREKKSEISGTQLGLEPLSFHFHHILPKAKYPQAKYDEENIILLTFDEHQTVELHPEFYEEINKRREQLKQKYGI